jgi:flagellar biosynthesis/type III secretory pathway protein FliH
VIVIAVERDKEGRKEGRKEGEKEGRKECKKETYNGIVDQRKTTM